MSGPAKIKIRAVSFDVGGTLIEPWPSVGHVYSAVAAESGMGEIDPRLLNQRFKSVWSERPGFDYSRAGWAQLVQRVFQGITNSIPETLFPRLYDRFSEPHVWRVFEDVMPVVQSLSERKIRLAVISNWDERLRTLLKTLGLEPFFEVLAISCEVGFPKPFRAIFDRAAASLQLNPGSILHVGDSYEMDVLGARAAGFHAVHLCRGLTHHCPGEVGSLSDLLPLAVSTQPD